MVGPSKGDLRRIPCRSTLADLDYPGLSWTQVSHPRCPGTEDFGNRTVTFGIDHTPLHRISVQFEWAEPFGELQ